MAKRRCTGKTRAGKRCKAWPLHDSPFCLAHDVDRRASVGFTPEAGKLGGRPRLPRPHELLREKIEGDLERWLAPLEDALRAERAIVVGSGESAEIERVPDHKIRLQAVREAHDRVYGKAAQAVELTGAGGGAVAVEVMGVDDFDAETRKLAHDLLVRAAGAEPK